MSSDIFPFSPYPINKIRTQKEKREVEMLTLDVLLKLKLFQKRIRNKKLTNGLKKKIDDKLLLCKKTSDVLRECDGEGYRNNKNYKKLERIHQCIIDTCHEMETEQSKMPTYMIGDISLIEYDKNKLFLMVAVLDKPSNVSFDEFKSTAITQVQSYLKSQGYNVQENDIILLNTRWKVSTILKDRWDTLLYEIDPNDDQIIIAVYKSRHAHVGGSYNQVGGVLQLGRSSGTGNRQAQPPPQNVQARMREREREREREQRQVQRQGQGQQVIMLIPEDNQELREHVLATIRARGMVDQVRVSQPPAQPVAQAVVAQAAQPVVAQAVVPVAQVPVVAPVQVVAPVVAANEAQINILIASGMNRGQALALFAALAAAGPVPAGPAALGPAPGQRLEGIMAGQPATLAQINVLENTLGLDVALAQTILAALAGTAGGIMTGQPPTQEQINIITSRIAGLRDVHAKEALEQLLQASIAYQPAPVGAVPPPPPPAPQPPPPAPQPPAPAAPAPAAAAAVAPVVLLPITTDAIIGILPLPAALPALVGLLQSIPPLDEKIINEYNLMKIVSEVVDITGHYIHPKHAKDVIDGGLVPDKQIIFINQVNDKHVGGLNNGQYIYTADFYVNPIDQMIIHNVVKNMGADVQQQELIIDPELYKQVKEENVIVNRLMNTNDLDNHLIDCNKNNYGIYFINLNVGGTGLAYPGLAYVGLNGNEKLYYIKILLNNTDKTIINKIKPYQRSIKEATFFEKVNGAGFAIQKNNLIDGKVIETCTTDKLYLTYDGKKIPLKIYVHQIFAIETQNMIDAQIERSYEDRLPLIDQDKEVYTINGGDAEAIVKYLTNEKKTRFTQQLRINPSGTRDIRDRIFDLMSRDGINIMENGDPFIIKKEYLNYAALEAAFYNDNVRIVITIGPAHGFMKNVFYGPSIQKLMEKNKIEKKINKGRLDRQQTKTLRPCTEQLFIWGDINYEVKILAMEYLNKYTWCDYFKEPADQEIDTFKKHVWSILVQLNELSKKKIYHGDAHVNNIKFTTLLDGTIIPKLFDFDKWVNIEEEKKKISNHGVLGDLGYIEPIDFSILTYRKRNEQAEIEIIRDFLGANYSEVNIVPVLNKMKTYIDNRHVLLNKFKQQIYDAELSFVSAKEYDLIDKYVDITNKLKTDIDGYLAGNRNTQANRKKTFEEIFAPPLFRTLEKNKNNWLENTFYKSTLFFTNKNINQNSFGDAIMFLASIYRSIDGINTHLYKVTPETENLIKPYNITLSSLTKEQSCMPYLLSNATVQERAAHTQDLQNRKREFKKHGEYILKLLKICAFVGNDRKFNTDDLADPNNKITQEDWTKFFTDPNNVNILKNPPPTILNDGRTIVGLDKHSWNTFVELCKLDNLVPPIMAGGFKQIKKFKYILTRD